MKVSLTLAFLAATFAVGQVKGQDAVKIGFITDLSGVYSDFEGKGGAVAMQMAIDDFGGKVPPIR